MYDVIIIGGGPAGMMASIKAGMDGEKVLLIEKNDRLGKKLELTGGTRCNVTNLKSIEDFIKEIPVNSKVLYSVLNQFSPQDIYDYFKEIGVQLKIEDNDRVFPVSNKSRTIIDALIKEMTLYHIEVHLNESVKNITSDKEVITNINTYKSRKIIITTGGYSYPQTGSTGDGYVFSKEINQPITETYPAETFLICKNILPLAGITIDNVTITLDKYKTNGSLLFTHMGISGPSVFKISEQVYHKLKDNSFVTISIDLVPNYTENELITKLNNYNPKKEIFNFVKEYLPKRLSEYVLDIDSNLKIGTLSKIKKLEIIKLLKEYKVDIKDTGSIEQSFVTGGGINFKYINPKTMESIKKPGIYYAGEILDIHGHTGGYNITIALSTGYVAGTKRNN